MPAAPTLSSETSLNRGAVRATVEHAAPAPSADAETKQSQEVAAAIRKRKEEKGASAAISEDMVNRKPPAFTEQRIQLAARKNIAASKLNPDGTVARGTDGSPLMTDEEQQRHDQIVAIGKLANAFKERGFDGLLAHGIIKIDGRDENAADFFKGRVEQSLMADPRIKAELSSISDPHQRNLALQNILNQPEVRANVHKFLSGDFDTQQALSMDGITSAIQSIQEKKGILEQKQKDKQKAEVKKRDAEKALREFKSKKLSTAKTKQEELDELSITVPEKQRTKQQYEIDEARAKEEVERYETLMRRGKLPPDEQKEYREKYAKATESLSNAKRMLGVVNADLGKYSQLFNEKAGYDNTIRQADEEISSLGGDIMRAENAYHDANANLGLARLERDAQEIEYVQKITAAFEKAAVEFVVKDIQANEQVAKEIKEEEITNTKDFTKKTFKRELRTRWGREVTETVRAGRFGLSREERTRTEWNATVDTDKVLLLDEIDGGPDAIIRKVMEGSMLPRAQIEAAMKDEAFLQEMRPRVVTELLDAAVNKAAESGDKTKAFTADQARIIQENDWVYPALVQRLKTTGKTELANFVEQQVKDNGAVSEDEAKAKHKLNFKELLLLVFGSAVFDTFKGGGTALGAAATATP